MRWTFDPSLNLVKVSRKKNTPHLEEHSKESYPGMSVCHLLRLPRLHWALQTTANQ